MSSPSPLSAQGLILHPVRYQILEHLFPAVHLAPTFRVRHVSDILGETLSSLGAGLVCVQLCVPSNTSAPSLESCTWQLPRVGLQSRFASIERKLENSKVYVSPALRSGYSTGFLRLAIARHVSVRLRRNGGAQNMTGGGMRPPALPVRSHSQA